MYYIMTIPLMLVRVSLSLIKTCTRSALDQFIICLKVVYLIVKPALASDTSIDKRRFLSPTLILGNKWDPMIFFCVELTQQMAIMCLRAMPICNNQTLTVSCNHIKYNIIRCPTLINDYAIWPHLRHPCEYEIQASS